METTGLKDRDIKLPFRVKAAYAAGSFGKTLLTCMLGAYSLYFYTNICGIDPIIASVIILVAKIWDFANDPIMGIIVDKTRSREGKCRVWLKYFSVPTGIIFALLFIMPDFGTTGKIVWFAIFYVLQDMFSTALLIPLNTMMGRMTTNDSERASMNAYSGMVGIAANLVAGSATLPLLSLFGGNDMKTGFAWVGVLYGVLYALSNLIVYWGTKGYDPVEAVADQTEETQNINGAGSGADSIKALITNVPWLLCIGMYFIIMLSVFTASNAGLFYFQYNLNDMNLYSIVNMLTLIVSVPAYILLKPAVKRIGCAKLAGLGCLLMAVAYAARFLLHDANSAIVIAGSVVGGFGQIMASSVVMLMVLNSSVYGEWKTGVSHEAILVSGYSVSYKVGSAIATPIAGFLLGMVPYVEGAATQEQSVQNLFFYENTLMVAVCCFIAMFLAFASVKYEKMLPQMRKEISEKK